MSTVTIKCIKITFTNGEAWGVPRSIIARSRANHYADKGEDYETTFNETLHDINKLTDWFQNNMNWEDFSDELVLLETNDPTFDYQEEFQNGNVAICINRLFNKNIEIHA